MAKITKSENKILMYFVNLIHKYGNIGIQPSFIIMLFLISAEKNRDLKIVDIEIR